ncbi:UDP-glucose 4-epimerase GalE [cf. Phormidesmis sp. LEGE 11477]|uniref:UDP-glucose 4-epimerase GalE n=1 Tax=cf. Phormidesmis sp. LEGE 11477 TaxID=1828680 RepID=UPI00187E1E43|nr:UDP-glucose 4-epimerase GalE [cf. Phormidesmis sp. LEGE 11477]MBE9064964.1 UDP-glucose 4-epimerase GalE [cf. Phormidesmis sp. LEGE 11477]
MTKDEVLVTGGAGYIGSHTVLACQEHSYPVVVLDNLAKGRRDLVPEGVPFYLGDVGDKTVLERIFNEHRISAVMHFAGDIVVPESVVAPLTYYANNTCKTRQLLQTCVDHGINRFVFSSTAAVYGQPETTSVSETAPTRPVNPYGTSKLMVEWMLRDLAIAQDFRYVALRYFNVAGADPLGRTGQSTPGATHLIKTACEVAAGKRAELQVFGNDYDTPDGTCIRDYIHVSDLARAHVSALTHLRDQGNSLTLNCGYGRGYSVRQVIEGIKQLSGVNLRVRTAPRRAGDVAALVADASRLQASLNWSPEHDNLDFILSTALDWEERLNAGG